MFSSEMTIAAIIANPNPLMLNASPIKAAVSISVIALMTNKNNPSVINVTGRVKSTKIGRTIVFSTAKMTLAIMAAPNPLISKPEKIVATTIKTSALASKLASHFMDE